MLSWIPVFNIKLYDEKTHKIIASHRDIVKLFEWFLSYAQKYNIKKIEEFQSGWGSYFGSAPNSCFHTGKVAINVTFTYQISGLIRYAPEIKYGIMVLPPSFFGRRDVAINPSAYFVIPRGSRHPYEAIKFYKWWADKGSREWFFESRVDLPFQKKWIGEFLDKNPEYMIFFDIINKSNVYLPGVGNVIPINRFYLERLNIALQNVIHQRKDPKQALNEVTLKVQQELLDKW